MSGSLWWFVRAHSLTHIQHDDGPCECTHAIFADSDWRNKNQIIKFIRTKRKCINVTHEWQPEQKFTHDDTFLSARPLARYIALALPLTTTPPLLSLTLSVCTGACALCCSRFFLFILSCTRQCSSVYWRNDVWLADVCSATDCWCLLHSIFSLLTWVRVCMCVCVCGCVWLCARDSERFTSQPHLSTRHSVHSAFFYYSTLENHNLIFMQMHVAAQPSKIFHLSNAVLLENTHTHTPGYVHVTYPSAVNLITRRFSVSKNDLPQENPCFPIEIECVICDQYYKNFSWFHRVRLVCSLDCITFGSRWIVGKDELAGFGCETCWKSILHEELTPLFSAILCASLHSLERSRNDSRQRPAVKREHQMKVS